MALEKLPFLAFSLALEKWRWNVFEKGASSEMNIRWWELQLRYLGVVPPTQRTQDDFDAGAKYQVISDQDYIKYFIATVLQFQIYSEFCQSINHVGPLHTCDFYRSREVGRVLRWDYTEVEWMFIVVRLKKKLFLFCQWNHAARFILDVIAITENSDQRQHIPFIGRRIIEFLSATESLAGTAESRRSDWLEFQHRRHQPIQTIDK